MTIIKLTYDNKKKLFSVPVILFKKAKSGIGRATEKLEACNAVMYLDTGSNLTSITEDEVEKLHLDSESFKTQRVGGIGGMVNTSTTDAVSVAVQGDSNTLYINLDQIAIHSSTIKRKLNKGRGFYAERGEETIKMICLLGLDALEKLDGKLEIDMKNKTGRIII